MPADRLVLLTAAEPGRRNRRTIDGLLVAAGAGLAAAAAVCASSAPDEDDAVAQAVVTVLGWAPALWRYLALYLAGGFVATLTQAVVTLLAGTAAEAQVPSLGASGAIAAVLGAYYVLYPNSRVLTLVVVFLVRIPAWFFLGGWFLLQLLEGNFGLFSASADGGGTAFFAHIGGFVFGVLIARLLAGAIARAPVPILVKSGIPHTGGQ